MASNPAVSVIMAVYNGEEHLDECIESICSQIFPDFEFIIVNDASTDRTPLILEDWQKKDSRIRVLRNKVNQERSISRNRAITAARAPLVAIMDADDHALPTRLALQTEFMRDNPGVQIAGGDMFIHGAEERWTHPRSNDEIRAALFFDSALFHPTVMLRKSILMDTKTWYDPGLPPTEDYGLWAALLKTPEAVFANIPEPLTYYRLSDAPRREYEDKQVYHANQVRNGILRQLGLEPTEDNVRCHLALLYGNAKLLGVAPARCAEFGNKLLDANAKRLLTTPLALERQIDLRLKRVFASDIITRKEESSGK